MIIFSIIIPHKNSQETLLRLLGTIPHREDLEVIVVDDNSNYTKDEWSGILDRYGKFVTFLFSSENLGAGNARNLGVSHAKGKWLLFADADDTYTDNLNDVLNKYADDNETDMVIINARGLDKNGNVVFLRQNLYIDNYIKKKLYSEKVLRYELWTPWSRMVKKELVNKYNIKFENVPVGNDMKFCLLCSKYAKNLNVEHQYVYNYYMPIGRSITNSYRCKPSNVKVIVDHIIYRINLYSEEGYFFKPSHLFYIYKSGIEKQYQKEYRRNYVNTLRYRNYNLFKDLFYFVSFLIGRFLKIL